jgi:chorismate-pyruvate lyase
MNWASPDLQNLVDLFFANPETLGFFREVSAESLPEGYRRLLAHPHHMTVANEEYHGSPVVVEVLAERQTDTHYSREIRLRRTADRRVVQYGIVRINRQQLPADVMAQIERKDKPLGRVLMEHDIMRTVRLLSLWQIVPGSYLSRQFEQTDLLECFGRTAFLYLNGLPVVELLEIVTL